MKKWGCENWALEGKLHFMCDLSKNVKEFCIEGFNGSLERKLFYFWLLFPLLLSVCSSFRETTKVSSDIYILWWVNSGLVIPLLQSINKPWKNSVFFLWNVNKSESWPMVSLKSTGVGGFCGLLCGETCDELYVFLSFERLFYGRRFLLFLTWKFFR